MVKQQYRINIIEPGPRPPFYRIAEHLWGRGCNIDSDGNSEMPEDTQWTELTIELRGVTGQRIDIDPISFEPLILQVRTTDPHFAKKVVQFIVDYAGGKAQHID